MTDFLEFFLNSAVFGALTVRSMFIIKCTQGQNFVSTFPVSSTFHKVLFKIISRVFSLGFNFACLFSNL